MDNQGVSILVVDDEFSVRDSLYNWFKNEGYRVDTAENGMEALKKLQEGPWDIALVDIKMPSKYIAKTKLPIQATLIKYLFPLSLGFSAVLTAAVAAFGLSLADISRTNCMALRIRPIMLNPMGSTFGERYSRVKEKLSPVA
jgi:CheY-like chemotaxis protein